MAKRTPWERLSSRSQTRASLAGVTVIGYRAGAWVPWSKEPKPATKYGKAKQRSLNRYGLTPSELSNFPPKNRKVLEELIANGHDFSWLRTVPKAIRPQAYRYYRDYKSKPPAEDIAKFAKAVPGWKKSVLDKEVNIYFAQHKNVSVPDSGDRFQNAHMLADPTYQRRAFYATYDANSTVINTPAVPQWWFWYH